jgi:GNAT superfamily N-acetyltransferase
LAGTAALPEWRQWIAYADGGPVAAALSFIRDGIAWLGWGATLPAFRGRGAHSALIAHRVNDACNSGCEYITTETAPSIGERTDASFRNCARSGFSFVYERFTYISMRSTNR